MGRIKFWARSRSGAETNSESHAPKQPLSQHLQGVADLAIELARLARPGDHQFSRDAELAGLMHDLGKYSEAFQKMLETGAGECQHAIHGAILTAGKEKPLYPHIALAIAGHHTGIPDHSGNELSLVQKLQNRRLQTEAEVQLGPAAADCERLRQALDKIAEFSRPSHNIPAPERDLYIRMLFSCLVDADRLDAAGKSPDQVALSAAVRLEKLFDHLNALRSASPDSAVKNMRTKVLEDCLRSAMRPGNLFSLSPYGTWDLPSVY
jgi:CRISPR-associated endonuclease/helicase Cas3